MHWCVDDAPNDMALLFVSRETTSLLPVKPHVPLRHKAFSVFSPLTSCSPSTDKQVHSGRVVLIRCYIVGCFSQHMFLQASSLDRVVRCHTVISRRAPMHRIRMAECEHASVFSASCTLDVDSDRQLRRRRGVAHR
mmetsp:Transcript_5188/g.14613  ORF Transcript_5188/g.14613 Transcript_5188/m.14613 type:complete len:136 (-) Transcript_5188:51-458(-)